MFYGTAFEQGAIIDAVTGESHTIIQGDRIESISQSEFDSTISALRIDQIQSQGVKRVYLPSQENRQAEWKKADDERQAYEKDQMRIRAQIFMKDRERWYQFYLNAGYTAEEADYKASQMMRGRF